MSFFLLTKNKQTMDLDHILKVVLLIIHFFTKLSFFFSFLDWMVTKLLPCQLYSYLLSSLYSTFGLGTKIPVVEVANSLQTQLIIIVYSFVYYPANINVSHHYMSGTIQSVKVKAVNKTGRIFLFRRLEVNIL